MNIFLAIPFAFFFDKEEWTDRNIWYLLHGNVIQLWLIN